VKPEVVVVPEVKPEIVEEVVVVVEEVKPEVIVEEVAVVPEVKPEPVVAELPSLEYLPPVEAKPAAIPEVVTAAPQISAPATTVPSIASVEIPSLEYLPPQAIAARKIRFAAWRTN
jgi:hypothetical protein